MTAYSHSTASYNHNVLIPEYGSTVVIAAGVEFNALINYRVYNTFTVTLN